MTKGVPSQLPERPVLTSAACCRMQTPMPYYDLPHGFEWATSTQIWDAMNRFQRLVDELSARLGQAVQALLTSAALQHVIPQSDAPSRLTARHQCAAMLETADKSHWLSLQDDPHLLLHSSCTMCGMTPFLQQGAQQLVTSLICITCCASKPPACCMANDWPVQVQVMHFVSLTVWQPCY